MKILSKNLLRDKTKSFPEYEDKLLIVRIHNDAKEEIERFQCHRRNHVVIQAIDVQVQHTNKVLSKTRESKM